MRYTRLALLPIVLAAFANDLFAQRGGPVPAGWHRSLKDAQKASARSGKPILLMTMWGPGV